MLAPAPCSEQAKRKIAVLLSGCISEIPEIHSSDDASLTEQPCLVLPGSLSAERKMSWLAGSCHSPPEMLVQSRVQGAVFIHCPGLLEHLSTRALAGGCRGLLCWALPTLGRLIPHQALLRWFVPELLYSFSVFAFPLTLTLIGTNITNPPVTDFCVSALGFLIPACCHLDLPLQEDVHTLLLVWG